ncbi:tyrosine-type recombinase/integrase [Nocardia shimofusensis]|uniref:tyrosine-type recombinase/integrase n=1 Tax=Nocardia shimofusensis TaxID=228596 RepID=UPI000B06E632|nr:site-specific integrase [Nocardia shimofusensis]
MTSNSAAVGPSMRPHLTSNRIQRHHPDPQPHLLVGLDATPKLVPAPPPAQEAPPRPFGDLSAAPIGHIAELAGQGFGVERNGISSYRKGMTALLERLEQFPGATWQQRWEAAGLDEAGHPARDLAGDDADLQTRVNTAALQAFCMRLIRPTLPALRSQRMVRYSTMFQRVAADALLDEFNERLTQQPVSALRRREAFFDVCAMMTVYGVDLSGLTAEALLHYSQQMPTHTATATAWPVLHDMGLIPSWAPRTLQDATIRGRQTIEELVGRHQLRNTEVRDLLIDYIRRRSVEIDYSTLDNLVRKLTQYFWKIIEDINPDQTDLRLDEQVAQEWKRRLSIRADGKPRQHIEGPLLTIRAFYLDIQTWAAAEPHIWARWVAPCPIRDADLRGFSQRRRRLTERMANRTRERQSLLPVLSEYVTTHWHRMRAILEAAEKAALAEEFVVDGVTWQRMASRHDRDHDLGAGRSIRVLNRETGELLRVTHEERMAFWQWAIVETLRLGGLRREELIELTHLSIRQYQRPNGEVVALLVVSPSKSDRERVIPMSAELFHVIAQVIRRHIREHGTVPVCGLYDQGERTFAEPLPYLFQRLQSGTPRAMSISSARAMVMRAAKALVPTHPEFADIRFSPHDFRRLFATDLVNNGLPIHIGAALLGHLDIQTTRGYVAVFEEDVVRHYQEFLDRRRAQRPAEEYRKPTEDEWAGFEEHFDKRRVELGSCGRPYGTACQHEHACIRCQMLSVNPKMLPRLEEIEEDLLARRQRAITEGWHGEVEGLELTLTFLRSKRDQTRRTAAIGSVALGIPVMPGGRQQ